MDRFAVNESRMHYFHRVLIDQARRTPGLIARALEALPELRRRRPAQEALWAEWTALLEAGMDAVEDAVLAPGAHAGLLRANSPLAEILEAGERNALWQRVGLQQFAAYHLGAVADLDLTPEEESAIVGLDEGTLEGWREAPPLTMTAGTLDALKVVIATQRALATLYPDQDVRRQWLRAHVDAFAARPIDLLVNGGGALVQQYLAQAVHAVLEPKDLPSH